MNLDRFPFDQVGRWLTEGGIVPFVGAAASHVGIIGDSPPDGPGLAAELGEAMAGAYPGDPSSGLAKIAQFYEHTVFDRAALYDYLHNCFEAPAFSSPGAVACMLAAIPRTGPLFMITTNYDSFIERAFARAGRHLCVITQNMRDPEEGASAVDLIMPDGSAKREQSNEFEWADPHFGTDCAFLFKMHGSVKPSAPSEPDNVIITEDDYVDFLVNSGGSAVSPYFPQRR